MKNDREKNISVKTEPTPHQVLKESDLKIRVERMISDIFNKRGLEEAVHTLYHLCHSLDRNGRPEDGRLDNRVEKILEKYEPEKDEDPKKEISILEEIFGPDNGKRK